MKIFIKVLFAYILLQPFHAFSESEGLKILVVGANDNKPRLFNKPITSPKVEDGLRYEAM